MYVVTQHSFSYSVQPRRLSGAAGSKGVGEGFWLFWAWVGHQRCSHETAVKSVSIHSYRWVWWTRAPSSFLPPSLPFFLFSSLSPSLLSIFLSPTLPLSTLLSSLLSSLPPPFLPPSSSGGNVCWDWFESLFLRGATKLAGLTDWCWVPVVVGGSRHILNQPVSGWWLLHTQSSSATYMCLPSGWLHLSERKAVSCL